jgi:hypothetical protein
VRDEGGVVGVGAGVGAAGGELCVVGQRVRVAPDGTVAAGEQRDAEGAVADALAAARK